MKYLIGTILILSLFLYGNHQIQLAQTQLYADLDHYADVRISREQAERRERELNNRVQSEARRLGSNRLDAIRSIILIWGNDWRVGLAIAKSESGLRCEAYHLDTNGTIDYSIFQLNGVHLWRGDLSNCQENIKIAYELYKTEGPGIWVVWKYKIAQQWL